ncbi:MAG: Na+/H+ antiporter NhaC family protein [Prevotellaceae bacterium]|nr:Na+/H+ antiporter NhaC family protein [Prevotellaceae bacterium]
MKKRPSAVLSLMPIVVLVAMLIATIKAFGSDSLGGASQITLLTVSALCVLIGMWRLNVPWASFEKAITKNVASVSSALIILLLIGALSGAWMVSGVVPTLVYYGVQAIHPDIFLASSCLICALVSVMTGSSWTTIATIGIALMGIGRAQGFGEGWVAGAIISGAYFGDKISPLSETTTLASASLGVPLFKHIRYMLITTVPSMLLALVLFAVGGLLFGNSGNQDIESFTRAIDARFNITPWLLAVPVLTGVLIARRTPPVITLFLSSLMAVIAGVVFQGDVLREIDPSTFKASMISLYGSTSLTTDNPMLTSLVATRGMGGMMDTIWLIICAMCFGGAMSAAGMVGGITRLFIHLVKGRTSLVGSTAATGLMLNLAIADQYLCILLSGNMFRDVYDREGYERRLLSRTTEDAVTVTSVLVPWNTCGMTQSTVLGVATFTYLPFCFFNIISPLMSVIVAMTGYKIYRKDSAPEELAADEQQA